jgi:hypothetical protein
VAETCGNAFVIQTMMQLVGNKLFYTKLRFRKVLIRLMNIRTALPMQLIVSHENHRKSISVTQDMVFIAKLSRKGAFTDECIFRFVNVELYWSLL